MATCIPAKIHSFSIYEGGTFDRDFVWTSSSTGLPIDLTGSQIYGVVREATNSTEVLIDLPFQESAWTADAPSGFYLTDPAKGTFKMYIKDEESFVCSDHVNIKCMLDAYINSPADEVILKLYGYATIVASAKWSQL